MLAPLSNSTFAALAALMMIWEREDNISMGSDLLLSTTEWLADEIAWQQSNDPRSPKVGEMAPDFALQDPSGEETQSRRGSTAASASVIGRLIASHGPTLSRLTTSQ